MKAIHLGYEVGSGEPVEVPLRHTVITGQTQEAGKTTALEAMIDRSELQGVVFVTKRGEGSFRNARRIEPYFREEADWQFVASILEASRGEKLRFERAWIIRASKGARSLVDVQRNVRTAMEKAKGLSADVYLTLDAYLDAVVPQIERVRWAKTIDLKPGLNAMDLGALNVEMQHLVIRSTIDWVLNHARDTVVVVPEAWKFIPQGRGTPVKLAAEAYIRQAAGLHNYLWLDSQDIAGVEKIILKSVPLWILGVQREANEVKRTLAQIPAGTKKPKPEQIATLGLGEFFVCHGTHITKVYVQPAWMDDDRARRVARGERDLVGPTPLPPESSQTISPEEPMKDLEAKLDQILSKLADGRAGQAGGPEPKAGPMVPASDEEALYQRFKKRLLQELPLNGAGPIQVIAPEKLRKDFQRDETARIVAAARELKPLQKRILKLVETTSDFTSQKALAERLGRSTGGGSWIDMTSAVKSLAGLGFVEVKERQGVRPALRKKIADDLAFYHATDADVDGVHQAVLYELATGEGNGEV